MFPKLEGLDSLARRDGVDIRPTLVRVLTDLYVQKPSHTSEEERHYTELALRLIDTVDLPTRAAIAKKIAAYPSAPPAVARRLARDVVEVAEPILRQCKALTSADLDAIIRDFGWNHAAIIAAKRGDLSAPAAAPVAPTVAPARITAARPPAADQQDLTLAELFFSADSGARRMLLASLGSIDDEAPQSVQPLETIRALEDAALRRDRAGFVTLLTGALSLSNAQAERIVGDPSGEPLLVAAKALAMPSVPLQRIIMFIDPAIGESVERFFDLATLYEKVSMDASHKLIGSLRGHEPVQQQARKPAAGHRPMYYDDEAGRTRRGAGAATRRPGTAEPQAPARTSEPDRRQRTT
jgi:uncharacterized protein (DUF2336 family)